MFKKSADNSYKEVLPGIQITTTVYGEKTLMTEFIMKAGSALPSHKHPHEQTGYLVSGNIKLTIGDQLYEVNPGDSWSIPADMEHNAEIIADTVAIEVFAPLREEYIEFS
jgi:unsaturated pyranuronate lyase